MIFINNLISRLPFALLCNPLSLPQGAALALRESLANVVTASSSSTASGREADAALLLLGLSSAPGAPLDMPPSLVRPAAWSALAGLAEREGGWEHPRASVG